MTEDLKYMTEKFDDADEYGVLNLHWSSWKSNTSSLSSVKEGSTDLWPTTEIKTAWANPSVSSIDSTGIDQKNSKTWFSKQKLKNFLSKRSK